MRKLTLLLLGISFLFARQSLAQNSVTGLVTDASGLPVPGATINIKNTRTGTSSAADGTFKINAPRNSILVITGVGFETKEVPIGNLSVINVSLKLGDQ